MTEIIIDCIELLDRKPTTKGVRHLAFCNVTIVGVATLRGCTLVEDKAGIRRVWAPACIRFPGEPKRSFRFEDEVFVQINAAATAAVEAVRKAQQRIGANDHALSATVELVRQVEKRDAA